MELQDFAIGMKWEQSQNFKNTTEFKHMDKLMIEEKLSEFEQKIECLQEPVHQVFETIENLMDKTKNTENLELMKFKLELSEILGSFYEKMVDVHDEIINDQEKIEKMLD